jgi:hypothetical protein
MLSVVVPAFALLASAASAQISYGTSSAVGDGWIRSYVQSSGGTPSRIGVQFNQAALDAFAASPDSVNILPLPGGAPAPFNHLMVDWNAHGHPGPGYDVPHFDFHFYFSTPAEVAAIPFSPAPSPIPSNFVAPGYIPDLVVVPQMGWHYLDSQSPEFSDPSKFTQTFIYGYYGGKMTFLEPMITLATLQGGGTHVLPVRQPNYVQTAGYYPTRYGFSETDGLYDVFLEGLRLRAVTPVPEPATWGLGASLLLAGLLVIRTRRRAAASAAAVA